MLKIGPASQFSKGWTCKCKQTINRLFFYIVLQTYKPGEKYLLENVCLKISAVLYWARTPLTMLRAAADDASPDTVLAGSCGPEACRLQTSAPKPAGAGQSSKEGEGIADMAE